MWLWLRLWQSVQQKSQRSLLHFSCSSCQRTRNDQLCMLTSRLESRSTFFKSLGSSRSRDVGSRLRHWKWRHSTWLRHWKWWYSTWLSIRRLKPFRPIVSNSTLWFKPSWEIRVSAPMSSKVTWTFPLLSFVQQRHKFYAVPLSLINKMAANTVFWVAVHALRLFSLQLWLVIMGAALVERLSVMSYKRRSHPGSIGLN